MFKCIVIGVSLSLIYACTGNTNQSGAKEVDNRIIIDETKIDSILVKQRVPDGHSYEYAVALVKGETIKELVREVNGAKAIGMCKFGVKYEIEFYSKGKVHVQLRSLEGSFKYNSDNCYSFKTKNYLKKFFK